MYYRRACKFAYNVINVFFTTNEDKMPQDNAQETQSSTSQPQNSSSTHIKGERIQRIKELGNQPETVRGHVMPASEIFKFSGLIVFILLMVLSFILIWPYMSDIFEPGGVERISEEVRNAGPGGFLILFGIQILQVVVAFIPGEVVQIAAGLIYGPWIGSLIIILGAIASSSMIFALVHHLGAPLVHSMVPDKYVDKLEEFEQSNKFSIIVFVLFLIPGLPKDVFTYVVPLSSMKFPEYIALTCLARIPGVFISTYAAAGLASGDYVESIIMYVVLAIVAGAALFVFTKLIDKHDAKKHADKSE